MFSPQMHYVSQPTLYSAPQQHIPAGNGFKNGGFSFRKRVERIDWRKMASIDVDQISRTLDFNALQENIINITFCSLESELDIRTVDPNFVKLFKLAQLTIEYLLYSQEYLAGLCTSLEDKLKISAEEQEKVKQELEDVRKELATVKAESHKRKKLLIAQQQLMHAGSGSYQKCPFCTKAFLNGSYLQSHIIRRHNTGVVFPPGSQRGGSGDSVPKAVSPDQGVGDSWANNPQFEAELAHLKERLRGTEAQLEVERRALSSMRAKESKIMPLVNERVEAVTEQQAQLHKQEMEEIKNVFMREVREVNEKYLASERALAELEKRYGAKRSYLGASLQDDVDNEKDALEEELQKHMGHVEDRLLDTLSAQEKRRQRKNANERKQRGMNQQAVDVEDEVVPIDIEQEEHVQEKMVPVKDEAKPRQSTMYPSDEEESFALRSATSSLRTPRTPGRSSSLGNSGGTLGMTGTGTLDLHTSQFLEQLRQNPSLGLMREQLSEVLAEMVAKCGIPRGAPGIDSIVLQHKLAMRSTQRKSDVQKFPNFMELRAHFDKEAEEKAMKILRQKKQSPRFPQPGPSPQTQSARGYQEPTRSASASRAPASAMLQQPQPGGSNHNTPRSSSMPSPRPRVQTTPKSQPQPQPRAGSPAKTGLSTGSTTEWTSTQWDSDEDSDGGISGVKPFSPSPNTRLIQSGPPPSSRPSPSPRQRSEPRVIHSKPLEHAGNDDYGDILGSEGEEDDRARTQPAPSRSPPTRLTSSAPQTRGQNVTNLARTIEKQLQGRGSESKPVGGVDTMGSAMGLKKNQAVLEDFNEDSDWDMEEQVQPPPRGGGGAGVRRSGQGSTDLSSNTYGTSQWGSTSKGASTVKPDPKRPASRSSFVSVSDLSSDDETNGDNV